MIKATLALIMGFVFLRLVLLTIKRLLNARRYRKALEEQAYQQFAESKRRMDELQEKLGPTLIPDDAVKNAFGKGIRRLDDRST